MRKRLVSWLWQFLIALDQLVQVWVSGWLFVWLGVGDCPNADETISSRVGRNAMAGRRWALVLERIIDRLAIWCGSPPGHCRRAIEYDELPGGVSTPG